MFVHLLEQIKKAVRNRLGPKVAIHRAKPLA
jgi:hypothetical protein